MIKKKIIKIILSVITFCIIFMFTANLAFSAQLVKFSWNPNSAKEDVKKYTLYYTLDGEIEKSIDISSPVVKEDGKIYYELLNLERKSYCFQLTASNDTGESERTTPPICTFVGVPNTPESVVITIEITVKP